MNIIALWERPQADPMAAELEAAYHELRVRCDYKPGDAQYDAIARVLMQAGCDQGLDPRHRAIFLQADGKEPA